MDGFAFNTPGLAGLERRLLELGSTVARKGGRAAWRRATNVILAETRIRALPHKKTGILQKNIYTRDGGVRGDTVYFSVRVRSQAFYAKFVEFGTVNAPPYPFMRPAAENKAQEAVATGAAYLGSWLETEWSRVR